MKFIQMQKSYKMKILQINKYFFKKGGAETVFFNTIQLLERHGHTVIPFSLKNKKNEPSPYESYFVDYPELSESSLPKKIKNLPAFIYNKEAARKLEKLIQKEKPDVAHIHLMFYSMSVSILPVLKKYNIPIIMSVHDYRLVCPAYTFTDGKRNFCERCKTCLLCTYLYNFTPKVEDYSSTKGDYIFFFGRISEEKGILTLLNAIKQVPDIKLKLAGTGPLLEQLKPQCPPNAEFLGFKQGEELRELIHNASFVVVSSECYENNPMTIIESYMIGTPVIGSDLGGIPELIIENKTGYTFKPKSSDDLKEMITKACSISEEEYARMSDEAKKFAMDNFSEESHYQRLIKNYQLIIDQNKR